MLRMRQAELRQEVEDHQARLTRVAARLREIEQEDEMSKYDVVLKKVDPVTVAAVRGTIPTYSDMGLLHGPLYEYLAKHRVNPALAQPCLSIYYDEEYRERDVDAEAAVGVDASLPSEGRVEIRTLPGVESMACVVHQGPYDTINEAYTALGKWIEANGYQIAGPPREVYVQSMSQGVDPSAYITELQFPVAKR
jgi:effector-binding domain-containing protein